LSSFLDQLLGALFAPSAPGNSRHSGSTPSYTPRSVSEGDILSGSVDFVAETFIKVSCDGIKAVIFRTEMAESRISHCEDVVQQGQSVEFLLLAPSEKKAGEWKGSLSAVREARLRQVVARMSVGDQVVAVVVDILRAGVKLDWNAHEIWVPMQELSWEWISHAGEVVRLGASVTVSLQRLECPSGWLKDRKRKTRLEGSLRACVPKPDVPTVKMPFSAVPFELTAVAHRPSDFDSVLCFFLERLCEGVTMGQLGAVTGFPLSSVQAIGLVMAQVGLLEQGIPTLAGHRLVEAVALERESRVNAVSGFFLSAADESSRIVLQASAHSSPEDQVGFPRPPYDATQERRFSQLGGKAVTELVLEGIASAAQRDQLQYLQDDPRLRICVLRKKSWKTVYVDVPIDWLLGGLWKSFDPLGPRAWRSADKPRRSCRQVLIIRMIIKCAMHTHDNQRQLIETMVYYEPLTSTFWLQKNTDAFNEKLLNNVVSPIPYIDLSVLIPGFCSDEPYSIDHQWCRMTIK